MTSPAQACTDLLNRMRSLQLSTVAEDGSPHCGYTPYLYQAPCSFFIFVSQLAVHTRDIARSGRAAIMIIQDEAEASQLFARVRVSYQCQCQQIATESPEYEPLLDQYQQRHGKMTGLLRQLPDFMLFRLQPDSGQFVMGFGKAYHLSGPDLQNFEHARSG